MRFIKYWLPVIIYAALIFQVSSVPGEDIPDLFPIQSYIFHFFEYFAFAFLIKRAIKEYCPKKTNTRRLIIVVAVVFMYSLFDEFHQSFIPNRAASLSDVFIDVLGSCAGSLIYK